MPAAEEATAQRRSGRSPGLSAGNCTGIPGGENPSRENPSGDNPGRNSEQNAYWRAIVRDLDDAVIRYTPDLTCRWCNAAYARLLGREVEAVVGHNISEFIGAERTAIALERVKTLLQQGSVREVEIAWDFPDGRRRWLCWNAQVVKSPLTGETELQSVGRDIHALKEREAKLEQAMARLASQTHDMATLLRELKAAKFEAENANAAKSRFLASMSHELRTPLNAIIGFAEIMRLNVFGPLGAPIYGEYTNDIWKSGHHLLELIQELLDLSRVESGLRRMHPAEIDPAALVKDTLAMMPPGQGAGIALDVHGVESCGAFAADPLAVRQATVNLLFNALKFTPPDGRVWLGFHRLPGSVEIEIGDSGPGLTRAQIEGLLSPNGTIDDQRLVARKGRGAGLGIPIAKSLVEAHGGGLRFESQPGEGTRAILNFPQPPVVPGARL